MSVSTAARPTIVYLHGFRSSPASVKATQLRAAVDAMPAGRGPVLRIPDLQRGALEAIAHVAPLVTGAAGPVTVVGSSLGGFYATHLAERYGVRAVMINPAVRPYEDLEPYLGIQTNLYTGEAFEVTCTHLDELRALVTARMTRPEPYVLLVEAGDEVLDYREAVAFYGGAWQYVRGGGDHAFQDYEQQLPAILRFAGVD